MGMKPCRALNSTGIAASLAVCAALSANATLANTNICNGVIGAEILPSLDSPNSFRKVPSSPTLSMLDILSSSLQSSMSNLSCSPSTSSPPEYDSYSLKSMSAPSRSEGFLNAIEVQVAGGAAGEDRVQAVCSEENGWLLCAIYDGFNGRDAADFLAGTLYENIIFHTNSLDWELKQNVTRASNGMSLDGSLQHPPEAGDHSLGGKSPSGSLNNKNSNINLVAMNGMHSKLEISSDSFRYEVLDSLQRALSQAENDFLNMVIVGLFWQHIGDNVVNGYEQLKAVQLSECHTVDNELERTMLLNDHPDDPATIVFGKVKGKLKVTRAFGVGYLKKKKLNDALMGILQVRNLISPPYISTQPSMNVHKVSKSDHFVIVGSDGLFDFFSNDEAVKLVHSYILSNPLLIAHPDINGLNILDAGFSMEELMNIPAGRRRKYHDDVTVIVIVLGTNHRTSKASMHV
ncbi:hypothetical protein GH714_018642 [Hevea brasiliensis]|uniref:PPM-type phosphatase domain-containing protein n=1 Tax=Hevea brasiliensis TaxID=3981 RepID=A0A6A6MLM3_HEVBR|nr:hypothetical protein GH714_018642 [Hevea brasiliensis]